MKSINQTNLLVSKLVQRLTIFALMSIGMVMLAGCSLNTGVSSDTKSSQDEDILSFVDPFIGTAGKGKTYPGATMPYGMVQLSPDNGRNGWDWIAGYFYPDNVIAGFSHTHLSGTGAGDLYDISFMPMHQPAVLKQLDEINPKPTIISEFSHNNEQASPGYYQVYLEDYDINVELTSLLRTGIQRYQFKREKQPWVKLDLGYSRNWDDTTEAFVEVIDEYTIRGFRKSTGWAKDQRVYFYTRFSQPIQKAVLSKNDKVLSSKSLSGTNIVAQFAFSKQANFEVEVHTAISSVSMQNAQLNYQADIAQLKTQKQIFEPALQFAQQQWRKELSRIKVEAETDNKIQFYTALYHSTLAPRIFSDSNGEYKGPDGNIHRTGEHPRYSFFSLWDTYRALHPWKTIVSPSKTTEMMHSLLAHYDEYGMLPVWNFQGNETNMMMGYHAVPVLVDAWLKGLLDTDSNYLLTAFKRSAEQSEWGIGSYTEKGYVPFEEISWNVSRTLEYAFDDWAIARFAQDIGNDVEYQRYLKRSKNFIHHFDPHSQFMRALDRDKKFKDPFDPLAYHPEDYCEANAWQYTFYVPHDVPKLIELYGGNHSFNQKLDEMFEVQQSEKLPEWISGYIGQYVHGNEPAHHVPYLYQFSGAAHKTEQRVRQIMQQLYTTKPDGLCGNEDAGQMSAWYLFSALGFYPVDPVSGQYVFGSPEVSRASITLENGKQFTVIAHNQSAENVYVRSIHLNGKPVTRHYLTHEEIMAGGELIFEMSATY